MAVIAVDIFLGPARSQEGFPGAGHGQADLLFEHFVADLDAQFPAGQAGGAQDDGHGIGQGAVQIKHKSFHHWLLRRVFVDKRAYL